MSGIIEDSVPRVEEIRVKLCTKCTTFSLSILAAKKIIVNKF